MPPVGEVQQDGRLTVTELAGRVGLSLSPGPPACDPWNSAISSYHAHLDASGLSLTFSHFELAIP
jgi:Winged helix-turn-helix DNA-binding